MGSFPETLIDPVINIAMSSYRFFESLYISMKN